jgi:polyribonucleotide 5'-hydroxyl-kinase
VADETPVDAYANLHFALETQRAAAASSGGLGPRVMLVGPDNAGKTSVAKFLAAYAVRSGRRPVVANLDPREGMLAPPDTLSAAALDADAVLDVEDGWGSSPITGPSALPVKLPLVYFYGADDPEARRDAYKPLVSRLALSVMNRLHDDADAKPAGCIVDAPGAFEAGRDGYDALRHAVSEFQGMLFVAFSGRR